MWRVFAYIVCFAYKIRPAKLYTLVQKIAIYDLAGGFPVSRDPFFLDLVLFQVKRPCFPYAGLPPAVNPCCELRHVRFFLALSMSYRPITDSMM